MILIAGAWIVSIGLIEQPWRGDRVRGPEGQYEQLLKKYTDRVMEPDRKWEWYVNGNYDEATLAGFIHTRMERWYGPGVPEPPPMTPRSLEEYVKSPFEPTPQDAMHQWLWLLERMYPIDC